MNFRIEVADDRVVAQGELDLASAHLIEDALAGRDGSDLVFDLSQISFIDATGLRALVRARSAHTGLRMHNPSPRVRRLLDLTGLDETLLEPTRQNENASSALSQK